MENDTSKRSKIRRAEIISGITVAGVIGLYNSIRTIAIDVNSIIEAQARNLSERQDRTTTNLERLLDRDRQDCKEAIQEVRNRLTWVEREVQGKRKK